MWKGIYVKSKFSSLKIVRYFEISLSQIKEHHLNKYTVGNLIIRKVEWLL